MMSDFRAFSNIYIAFDDDMVTNDDICGNSAMAGKNTSMANDDVVSKREIRINQGDRHGMIPLASKI